MIQVFFKFVACCHHPLLGISTRTKSTATFITRGAKHPTCRKTPSDQRNSPLFPPSTGISEPNKSITSVCKHGKQGFNTSHDHGRLYLFFCSTKFEFEYIYIFFCSAKFELKKRHLRGHLLVRTNWCGQADGTNSELERRPDSSFPRQGSPLTTLHIQEGEQDDVNCRSCSKQNWISRDP